MMVDDAVVWPKVRGMAAAKRMTSMRRNWSVKYDRDAIRQIFAS
jgi:hypothetical protein